MTETDPAAPEIRAITTESDGAQLDPGIVPGDPARGYTSVWRLRADAWATIADVTRRLSVASLPDDQVRALRAEVAEALELLEVLETYWAHPGRVGLGDLVRLWDAGEYERVMRQADTAALHIAGQEREAPDPVDMYAAERPAKATPPRVDTFGRPTFEVLVVDGMAETEAEMVKQEMRRLRRPEDPYTYELVVVSNFNDAVLAVLFNADIQACVLRPGFAAASPRIADQLRHFPSTEHLQVEQLSSGAAAVLLGDRITELRPELDLYLVANRSIEQIAGTLTRSFERIFESRDALELHLSILRGVQNRHETPLFTAVRGYSRQPTGVFHALPISRGKSVVNSPWIHEMSDFYGLNIFLAETSTTAGGLDSLLEPSGPIKRAQELAARAFGARQTYFVTNGTSTANKIVTQSIVTPGDVVLVDRNCHKSHHYALMLAGARVNYLDAYPIQQFSMYGAVPLAHIKQQLLDYQAAGRLHEVKLLSLTNCTFDGIVYDAERVMHECLAIKPDLVFLWDEAWFAFAGFHPIYRRRTAMAAARVLHDRYRSEEYARQFAEAGESASAMPDPDQVRVRVYATQSTHKTLTSLRQGSMIHVYDEDFGALNEVAFHEAYMTHTSTSPNYQILASLDAGRAQTELEGYGLVERQAELAMHFIDTVTAHPLIRKYFRVLYTPDMIPPRYRQSGIESPSMAGYNDMVQAWAADEFVRDPSRLTLYIGLTGIDGDTFRHSYLMDRYGIQVNKTSRNTVLFMTNIGTTRSAMAHLIEVLLTLATELDEQLERLGPLAAAARQKRIAALTGSPPPLPDFSEFAEPFRPRLDSPDGDVRSAYFLAYKHAACEFLLHDEIATRLAEGREVVSANFIIPYPPGCPVLVPGQVFTTAIVDFMAALDTKEIHGYDHDFGYRVFTEAALRGLRQGPRGDADSPCHAGQEPPASAPRIGKTTNCTRDQRSTR